MFRFIISVIMLFLSINGFSLEKESAESRLMTMFAKEALHKTDPSDFVNHFYKRASKSDKEFILQGLKNSGVKKMPKIQAKDSSLIFEMENRKIELNLKNAVFVDMTLNSYHLKQNIRRSPKEMVEYYMRVLQTTTGKKNAYWIQKIFFPEADALAILGLPASLWATAVGAGGVSIWLNAKANSPFTNVIDPLEKKDIRKAGFTEPCSLGYLRSYEFLAGEDTFTMQGGSEYARVATNKYFKNGTELTSGEDLEFAKHIYECCAAKECPEKVNTHFNFESSGEVEKTEADSIN